MIINYLFCDVETTGLDPEVDQITEVGWLLDKFDTTTREQIHFARGHFLLRHTKLPGGWRLDNSDYITKLKEQRNSFISPQDFRTILLEHIDQTQIGKVYLVNANPAFDHSFLKKVLDPVPYHYHLIDIEVMAMQKWELFTPPSLKEICSTLKITNSNPHDALADCEIARIAFYKLLLEGINL